MAPPAAKIVELSAGAGGPTWPTWTDNTIWPDVEARAGRPDRITQLDHRVRHCDDWPSDLPARLNEIHAARCGIELAPDTNQQVAGGAPAAHRSGPFGAPPVLARAHHGSISKEQRAVVEEDLKRAGNSVVVATSSLSWALTWARSIW